MTDYHRKSPFREQFPIVLLVVALTASIGCATTGRPPETPLEKELLSWLSRNQGVARHPLPIAVQEMTGGLLGTLITKRYVLTTVTRDGHIRYFIQQPSIGAEEISGYSALRNAVSPGAELRLNSFGWRDRSAVFSFFADTHSQAIPPLVVIEVELANNFQDRASLIDVVTLLARLMDFGSPFDTLALSDSRLRSIRSNVQLAEVSYRHAPPDSLIKLSSGRRLLSHLEEELLASERYAAITDNAIPVQEVRSRRQRLRADLDQLVIELETNRQRILAAIQQSFEKAEYHEALAICDDGLARYPGDADLTHFKQRLEETLRILGGVP